MSLPEPIPTAAIPAVDLLSEAQGVSFLCSEHPNSSIYGADCQQQNEAREHRAGATILLCLVSVYYPQRLDFRLRLLGKLTRDVQCSPISWSFTPKWALRRALW